MAFSSLPTRSACRTRRPAQRKPCTALSSSAAREQPSSRSCSSRHGAPHAQNSALKVKTGFNACMGHHPLGYSPQALLAWKMGS